MGSSSRRTTSKSGTNGASGTSSSRNGWSRIDEVSGVLVPEGDPRRTGAHGRREVREDEGPRLLRVLQDGRQGRDARRPRGPADLPPGDGGDAVTDETLAQQIHEIDFLDLLKLGFAGIIVYGSYRLVKR